MTETNQLKGNNMPHPTVEKDEFKAPEPPSGLEEETKLPTDRKILDTLYSHYGKPSNIMQEKVKFYFGYSTPAGMIQKDWIVEGWQQGRVNVYIKEDGDETSLFGGSPIIPREGVGSWFIGVKGNQIKVYIAGELDTILEIGDNNDSA